MASVEKVGWILVAVVGGCVYLAAVVATIDGAVRAVRTRDLPAWMVGIVVAAILMCANGLLGTPFGGWEAS